MEVWLPVVIPSLVSIVGFWCSSKSLKNSFKAEMSKEKAQLQMEKMSEIPWKVFDLVDYIVGKQEKISKAEQLKRFSVIMNTTYAYGSKEAVSIIAALQTENYETNKLNEGPAKKQQGNKIMCLYVLLASQVKYDLTDTLISPEYWFKMKLNDYNGSTKIDIDKTCNVEVEQLNLNSGFKIL